MSTPSNSGRGRNNTRRQAPLILPGGSAQAGQTLRDHVRRQNAARDAAHKNQTNARTSHQPSWPSTKAAGNQTTASSITPPKPKKKVPEGCKIEWRKRGSTEDAGFTKIKHPARKEVKLPRMTVDSENPVLRFSPKAWAKLVWFRDRGSTEIGGFAITREGDPSYVEEFITVQQEASSAFVKFDPMDVNKFVTRMYEERGIGPDRCLRIWLHTHPGSSKHSANPSGVDKETFADSFGDCDWAIMFILSRGGDIFARLKYNIGPGSEQEIDTVVDYETAPFEGVTEEDVKAWEDEYVNNLVDKEWVWLNSDYEEWETHRPRTPSKNDDDEIFGYDPSKDESESSSVGSYRNSYSGGYLRSWRSGAGYGPPTHYSSGYGRGGHGQQDSMDDDWPDHYYGGMYGDELYADMYDSDLDRVDIHEVAEAWSFACIHENQGIRQVKYGGASEIDQSTRLRSSTLEVVLRIVRTTSRVLVLTDESFYEYPAGTVLKASIYARVNTFGDICWKLPDACGGVIWDSASFKEPPARRTYTLYDRVNFVPVQQSTKPPAKPPAKPTNIGAASGGTAQTGFLSDASQQPADVPAQTAGFLPADNKTNDKKDDEKSDKEDDKSDSPKADSSDKSDKDEKSESDTETEEKFFGATK